MWSLHVLKHPTNVLGTHLRKLPDVSCSDYVSPPVPQGGVVMVISTNGSLSEVQPNFTQRGWVQTKYLQPLKGEEIAGKQAVPLAKLGPYTFILQSLREDDVAALQNQLTGTFGLPIADVGLPFGTKDLVFRHGSICSPANTLLHYAAYFSSEKCAKYLLETMKVKCDTGNYSGNTPLVYARLQGKSYNVTWMLLKAGADYTKIQSTATGEVKRALDDFLRELEYEKYRQKFLEQEGNCREDIYFAEETLRGALWKEFVQRAPPQRTTFTNGEEVSLGGGYVGVINDPANPTTEALTKLIAPSNAGDVFPSFDLSDGSGTVVTGGAVTFNFEKSSSTRKVTLKIPGYSVRRYFPVDPPKTVPFYIQKAGKWTEIAIGTYDEVSTCYVAKDIQLPDEIATMNLDFPLQWMKPKDVKVQVVSQIAPKRGCAGVSVEFTQSGINNIQRNTTDSTGRTSFSMANPYIPVKITVFARPRSNIIIGHFEDKFPSTDFLEIKVKDFFFLRDSSHPEFAEVENLFGPLAFTTPNLTTANDLQAIAPYLLKRICDEAKINTTFGKSAEFLNEHLAYDELKDKQSLFDFHSDSLLITGKDPKDIAQILQLVKEVARVIGGEVRRVDETSTIYIKFDPARIQRDAVVQAVKASDALCQLLLQDSLVEFVPALQRLHFHRSMFDPALNRDYRNQAWSTPQAQPPAIPENPEPTGFFRVGLNVSTFMRNDLAKGKQESDWMTKWKVGFHGTKFVSAPSIAQGFDSKYTTADVCHNPATSKSAKYRAVYASPHIDAVCNKRYAEPITLDVYDSALQPHQFKYQVAFMCRIREDRIEKHPSTMGDKMVYYRVAAEDGNTSMGDIIRPYGLLLKKL